MSGSFMPFCVILFIITSLIVGMRNTYDPKTTLFLKFVQALTIAGAISESLIEFFDGSVVQGFAGALFVGVVYLVFTTDILHGIIPTSRRR